MPEGRAQVFPAITARRHSPAITERRNSMITETCARHAVEAPTSPIRANS